MEWFNKYNSFNSYKGLTYYDNYKKIMAWMNGDTSHLPPPIECNLDPIAKCNNRCYFCINQRYLFHNRSELGDMTTLPNNYMLRLIDFLSHWGVKGLCISGGGEPTLHKGSHILPGYAVSKGMKASFFTNGTNLTPLLVENLLLCQWVSISVNAGDRESYQKVSGRDWFEKVIDNISALTQKREHGRYDTKLTFKFLILPENIETIVKATKLAKELGMQNIHIRPADLERKDIRNCRRLEVEPNLINDIFERCHEEETEEFRVYTISHKFDARLHVKHDFENCSATPLVIPVLSDGNAYLCVDKKMESAFKLGSCYPDPEKILDWWGSDKHRNLIKSVDVAQCSRCTWSQYNQQIENVVLKDGMSLAFP